MRLLPCATSCRVSIASFCFDESCGGGQFLSVVLSCFSLLIVLRVVFGIGECSSVLLCSASSGCVAFFISSGVSFVSSFCQLGG